MKPLIAKNPFSAINENDNCVDAINEPAPWVHLLHRPVAIIRLMFEITADDLLKNDLRT